MQGDGVFLAGPNLDAIHADCAYARITIVGLNEELCGNGSELYQNLRRIDYCSYQVNPDGFMMQISARKLREQVRVSKDALDQGIGFAAIGKQFIDAYHRVPCVAHVQMIFVTDDSFDYAKLQKIAMETDGITKALDHLTGTMPTDCSSCGLQKICGEVQEMLNHVGEH